MGISMLILSKGLTFILVPFHTSRGNALSSIMAFTFKEGSTERFRSRFTLGATEAGLSFEGPLSKKRMEVLSELP